MMKPTLTNDSRLLPLNVYRTRYDMDKDAESDCTNGGASAKHNTLYIPHPRGHVKMGDVDARLVFIPEQRGPTYWAISPYVEPQGQCGPMAGGNLATSSDSRAEGRIYHVHDRFETWAQYEALSR